MSDFFSQMHMSTQIKDDRNDFFSDETLKHPPTLSKCSQTFSGN